ncbi:hypothetical protein [Mucisphaera calidilacus]|uniref:Uncharacterized protein n=1 Tax=Mucisphaera calidilacus TaxID=2527982 RepID=A0A518BUC4_9BACT|nr:hypothetical protein [Mucisphaera calidilacus]QDU70589.1 hypothetical protein Pan265_04170 [Mucisphaera calidilacus]
MLNPCARAIALIALIACLITPALAQQRKGEDSGQLAVEAINKGNQAVDSPLNERVKFMAWDFTKLGYHISPSELLALRFENVTDQPVNLSINWRVERYDNLKVITQGELGLELDAKTLDAVPLTLPANLPDGCYRLHLVAEDTNAPGKQLRDVIVVDYRAPQPNRTLNARLATLLDCNDPEGFITLATGPLRTYVEAMRSMPPEASDNDVILLQAEIWRERYGTVESVVQRIRAGTPAIIFAKFPAELDDVAPVTIDRDNPWVYEPRSLESVDFWPTFDPENGPRHYATNVTAKPGSIVHARWEDGRPAIVSQQVGEGVVYYFSTAPGRTWEVNRGNGNMDEMLMRCVYDILGRSDAGTAIDRMARENLDNEQRERQQIARFIGDVPDHAQVGASERNFARFGWHLVSESGLNVHIGYNSEIQFAADLPSKRGATTPEAIMTVNVPGMEGRRAKFVEGSWISRTIDWADNRNVTRLRSTLSPASPFMLWETRERTLNLDFVTTRIAVMTRNGPRTLSPGESIDGRQLTANWIIAVNGDPEHRDSPRLIALTRRPTTLTLNDNQLSLAFNRRGGADALAIGTLFGVRHFAPGQTGRLINDLPEQWQDQADRSARLALAFPVDTDEMFWFEDEDLVIANRYTYRTLGNDWRLTPLKVAMMPPFAALNMHNGVPNSAEQPLIDLKTPTIWGPLLAAEGDRITYRLRLPARDHFGPIRVERDDPFYEHIDNRLIHPLKQEWTANGFINRPDRPSSNPMGDLNDYLPSAYVPMFEAWHSDLYKLWFCFPAVAGRPVYGPEARQVADDHHRKVYRDILNFYPHRSIIHHRREPITLLDYPINFIWPTNWNNGRRYYVDQDESWTVIAYCWEMYTRYYGDWTTTKSNWNMIQWHSQYNSIEHDWAGMAASNLEEYFNLGHDCINAQYPGHLAHSRLAAGVGDKHAERHALYLAGKTIQPTVARWFMKDYLESITEQGDPWRQWRWHATLSDTRVQGYDTAVDPDARRTLSHNSRHHDTSKGTSTEFMLMYKQFAFDRLDEYQRELRSYEPTVDNFELGTGNSMARVMVEWPREEILATALKTERKNSRSDAWRSLMAPHNLALIVSADNPLFIAEWAPAEYVSGSFDPDTLKVSLVMNNVEHEPCTLRLYTQRRPDGVAVNDAAISDWAYDENKGWLTIEIPGNQQSSVVIDLTEDKPAELHPYFPTTWQE